MYKLRRCIELDSPPRSLPRSGPQTAIFSQDKTRQARMRTTAALLPRNTCYSTCPRGRSVPVPALAILSQALWNFGTRSWQAGYEDATTRAPMTNTSIHRLGTVLIGTCTVTQYRVVKSLLDVSGVCAARRYLPTHLALPISALAMYLSRDPASIDQYQSIIPAFNHCPEFCSVYLFASLGGLFLEPAATVAPSSHQHVVQSLYYLSESSRQNTHAYRQQL